MLQGGAAEYAESAPWRSRSSRASPSVFAFDLCGDSLRDVLDPKLRTL